MLPAKHAENLDGGNCPSMMALERSMRHLPNEMVHMVVQ